MTDELRLSSYCLLTTQRKNGTPVATPMWVAWEDARTGYMQTYAQSAKVRRLRNQPAVTLAPCDARGTPSGSSVSAVASVFEVDSAVAKKADQLLAQRYGWSRKLIHLVLWLTGKSARVYLKVEVQS